jgi:hypothetical protein
MIICSSSNIDLIQGVTGYGTVGDGVVDWRIENTATGVFNVLNSPNLLTPNLSIIESGNVGIGTIPTTGTNKLQVQGNINVSGGYFVGGVAFKPATAVLADTATVLAANRNIAGVGFNGSAAIDIPYFNLTNKITAGTGISLTTGSASTSPSISTNLTAGTNVTFTGTAPNIIINASGGGTSQWTTTGNNIYYNTGSVGIGTATLNTGALLDVNGSLILRVAKTGAGGTEGIYFRDGYVSANRYNCSILTYDHSGDNFCDGLSINAQDGVSFCTGADTRQERLRITSNGNIGIGTNNPQFRLEVSGTISHASFTAYYLNSGGTGTYGGPWNSTCAKFNGDVWCTNTFFSSDSRIKEDIQDISDDNALQSILSIEPKTYKYVDKLEKGNRKVYGFIAQQIREVIPEIVSIQIFYIPNIYLVADYNSNVITLSSQPTKVVIKVDDKIKCYDKDNKEILVEVIEVIDDLTFRIKDIEYSDTEIFVYGTEVDDFHTLNKDYIFTLNVCATQELHRRIESQSLLIKSQDDRIKELETKMERMLSNT